MLLSLVFDAERSMVREIPSGTGQAGMFEDLVRDWILSRPDLDAYRKAKRPYPVIVTSAEGGGIVAAAHSFLVLSALQILCPNFTQHIFASIGVSGGSLGNALFAARMRNLNSRRAVEPCKPVPSFNDINFASTDFLTPVLAAFLFVDIPNALLPGRLFRSDRVIAATRSATR
jgi:hypothetical protein